MKVTGGPRVLAGSCNILVVNQVIDINMQLLGNQAAQDMLAQFSDDDCQVDRISHFPAENIDTLLIGLDTPEEHIIHETLQPVAERVQPKRQDEYQQADEERRGDLEGLAKDEGQAADQ